MMLCNTIDKKDLPVFVAVAGSDWIAEEKYDGDRVQLHKINGKVKLIARGKSGDITFRYPEFQQNVECIPDGTILDGEMCVMNENGVSEFNDGITHRSHLKDPAKIENAITEYPVTYVVFDCIASNAEDLTNKPWTERRKILDGLNLNHPNISVSPFTHNIIDLWNDVIGAGGEGVILKKTSAPYYTNKRSSAWRKVKNVNEVDLVFTKYSRNPKGIRIETDDGIACQVSGYHAPPVQQELDKNGKARVSINILGDGMTASGKYRQPTFKKLVENTI